MFITKCLMYYVRRRRIPGKINIGKYRYLPPITLRMKKDAVAQLIQEEENLKLLQTPYISEEEEYRHVVDSGRRQEDNEEKIHKIREERMFKHKYMKDHIEFLNVSRKWE